jgi:hypothetical protein
LRETGDLTKQNMTTKKDAGKDQRIVLNLNMAQASDMVDALQHAKEHTDAASEQDFCSKIIGRIQKTISKHKNSEVPMTEAEMDREEKMNKRRFLHSRSNWIDTL